MPVIHSAGMGPGGAERHGAERRDAQRSQAPSPASP